MRLIEQDELQRCGPAGIDAQGLEQVARADRVVSRFAQLRPEESAGPVHRDHDQDAGRRHPLARLKGVRKMIPDSPDAAA